MPDDDILEILEIELIHCLVGHGIERARVDDMLGPFFQDFRRSYGATRWMIKRGHRRRYSPEQIAEIKRKYNGNNGEALQEQYGISRATLYRYLAN